MRHIKPLDITHANADRLMDRIFEKVHLIPAPVGVDGWCWWFDGTWANERGHKKIRFQGRPIYVHRATYTIRNGDIPEGLVLDHKCREPGCCNPDHLEAVTVKENTERGNGKWIFEQGYTGGRTG